MGKINSGEKGNVHKNAHNESVKHEPSPSHSKSLGLKEKLHSIYVKDYKKLMIIPNLLLFLSFAVLFFNLFTTGQFIEKGVSIQGGVSITVISKTLQSSDVETFLKQSFPKADVETKTLSGAGEQIGLIIEASDVTADELLQKLTSQYGISKNDYTAEVTGSKLGNSFYNQLIIAVIIAFILMAIVVYIYYRMFVPSFAIILAAFSDMITTLAIISLLGVKLTTAGIAALLMLIGYSVDTDILLTTRVVKRKEGTIDERIFGAFKTGMTMSAAAIATTVVALTLSHSDTLKQIMIILLIGLLADIIYTWIQNAGLLKWYMEKHHDKK